MAKDWKCSVCKKRFRQKAATYAHIRAVHNLATLPGPVHDPRRYADDEPSIASQLIQAQLDRACGDPIPDWLADMLPD